MATVQCPSCGEEHRVEDVKFVNVEESPEGWDLYEFICPETGDTVKAFVRG